MAKRNNILQYPYCKCLVSNYLVSYLFVKQFPQVFFGWPALGLAAPCLNAGASPVPKSSFTRNLVISEALNSGTW